LVYATGKALDIDSTLLDVPAVAVELIHAYSLVHDDLPAMDNDDLRRGRPTCHKAYDDGTAILVGDALQSLAFYVLSHGNQSLPAEQRLSMIESLSLSAGSRGMCGGQAIDIASVDKELNQAELDNMHIHKTGALLRASVRLGMACKVNIDESTRAGLDHYARCIGLAFQIRDDILDIEGETIEIGKRKGSDEALNKPTYPSVIGLSESKEAAEELYESAIKSIDMLDEKADSLRQLADFIVHRCR
jgi:farnesyl diphosphate synthase